MINRILTAVFETQNIPTPLKTRSVNLSIREGWRDRLRAGVARGRGSVRAGEGFKSSLLTIPLGLKTGVFS
jgi:hypothetical protein